MGLFSGTDNSAQQAQVQANRDSRQHIAQMANVARNDVRGIFPSAQADLNQSYNDAFGMVAQGIPQQLSTAQQGNMGAQAQVGNTFDQQRNAILGGQVDSSTFAPQQVNYDTSFMNQYAPSYTPTQIGAANYQPSYTSGGGSYTSGGGGSGGGGLGGIGNAALGLGSLGLALNGGISGGGLATIGSGIGNALGIGGGAASAAPAIASALAPASGAVSGLAGTGAASFFGGGGAASGLGIAGGGAPLTSTFTAGAFPAATGPVGGVAGGGGGIGGLFGGQAFGGGGAGTLGAIAAPAALFAASIPASKFIARDVLGFGSETDARRDQLADWSENSGFDDYKSMVSAESGLPYGDYIESKRPPTNPFQDAVNSIKGGDRSYQEEELMNLYNNTPWGQQQMQKFYTDNPDWYTPEGKRVFSGAGAERDRAAQAWYDGGKVGPNPASEYVSNVLNRDDYGMINGLGFKQTRN